MKKASTTTIGGKIRIARQGKQLSIRDLSKLLEINPNYLDMIELGKKNPSKKLLEKMAITLDTTVEALIPDNNPPKDKIQDLNLSLFLKILLHTSPDITKQTLATLMMISTSDLEAVLNNDPKKAPPWNPLWEDMLRVLSQRTPQDTVIDKLQTCIQDINDIISFYKYSSPKK